MMKKFGKIRKLPVILALIMVLSILPGNVYATALSTPNRCGQTAVLLEQGESYSYASFLNTVLGNGTASVSDTITVTVVEPYGSNYLFLDSTNNILIVNSGVLFAFPLSLKITDITKAIPQMTITVYLAYDEDNFVLNNPYSSTSLTVGMADATITSQLKNPIVGPAAVMYTSSNPSVLTVDNITHTLHVVSPGSADITASLRYGVIQHLEKTISYTVSAAATSQPSTDTTTKTVTTTGDVTLDSSDLELKTGDTDTITATCDTAVTWSSSNSAIAMVDSQGNVTAVSPGTAVITCTSGTDSESCNVTVSDWSVSWNASTSTLQVGKKTTAIKPVLEDGDSVQSYTSSNLKVATVSGSGKITALKAGTAVITVKTVNGAEASMNLTCKEGKVLIKTITLTDTVLSLTVKGTYTINAAVSPISSSEKLSYTSSNKKIAKVSSSGRITARKAGTCTITVKSQSKTKRIKLTVTN